MYNARMIEKKVIYKNSEYKSGNFNVRYILYMYRVYKYCVQISSKTYTK